MVPAVLIIRVETAKEGVEDDLQHLLGVPIRLRLPGVVVFDAAKTLPLDQRRKRGRPALARRALHLQP